MACRIATVIESDRRAGEVPLERQPPNQPKLGILVPKPSIGCRLIPAPATCFRHPPISVFSMLLAAK